MAGFYALRQMQHLSPSEILPEVLRRRCASLLRDARSNLRPPCLKQRGPGKGKHSEPAECIIMIKCHLCTVLIVCTVCSWCAWCAQCAHKKCTHKLHKVCIECTDSARCALNEFVLTLLLLGQHSAHSRLILAQVCIMVVHTSYEHTFGAHL